MSRAAWRVERRRAFLFLLACGLLWIPRTAEAQSATRIPRIGFLATPTAEVIKGRVAAFEQALHELGYVDGKGIIIEYRFADGKFERLPHPPTPSNLKQLQEAEIAARALGMQVQPVPVRNPTDFEAAFKVARGADGLLLLDLAFFTTHRSRLVELAASSRLPTV